MLTEFILLTLCDCPYNIKHLDVSSVSVCYDIITFVLLYSVLLPSSISFKPFCCRLCFHFGRCDTANFHPQLGIRFFFSKDGDFSPSPPRPSICSIFCCNNFLHSIHEPPLRSQSFHPAWQLHLPIYTSSFCLSHSVSKSIKLSFSCTHVLFILFTRSEDLGILTSHLLSVPQSPNHTSQQER